ncbi:conserved protein of unknown function [Limnospira indica PCC 8005]|uniref:Uncharacterized protein n=2 Tax=Oscillatoriophycideae TaxID=1301283 RepID=A0A9P1KG52_9CYAN|nr:conserved protein of unknown function [Limnospira indica PCC 8005]
MDKLAHYQNIIKDVLSQYDKLSSQIPDPDIDEILIFDDERS